MMEQELIKLYPRLWHMAHPGSWPAIRSHGLMSAGALIRDYELSEEEATSLRSQRRPESVHLARTGRPGAVLRDQKPMFDSVLAKCLTGGMTPQQWYEYLNSFTFFWLSRDRIWRLLRARAYRNVTQTVLTIDTQSLVAAHRERIWLSPMNSGSTIQKALPRGADTFRRIDQFPFEERARTRRPKDNVVELVVEDAVSDIAEHVLAVHECRNDKIIGLVWRRPGASADEQP